MSSLHAVRPAAGIRFAGRRTEVGSVLALVPAAFLVLVFLGAIAVDSAVAYLGQQQLHDALTAAANDAASAGIDNTLFYRGGRVVLDGPTARAIVCQSIEAQHFSQLHNVQVTVMTDGPEITVWGTASVDAVFGRAIPGFATRTVRASVDAVAETGATATGSAPNGAAGGPGVLAGC